MSIVLASFTIVAVILTSSVFAVTENPFWAIFAALVGGTGMLFLFASLMSIHPHRLEKIQTIKYYENQLAVQLEDDMALMNAVYNKIHDSYKPYLVHDYRLYEDRLEQTGLKIDKDRIEIKYYDYLYDPYIQEYVQNAMDLYSKPEYDNLL